MMESELILNSVSRHFKDAIRKMDKLSTPLLSHFTPMCTDSQKRTPALDHCTFVPCFCSQVLQSSWQLWHTCPKPCPSLWLFQFFQYRLAPLDFHLCKSNKALPTIIEVPHCQNARFMWKYCKFQMNAILIMWLYYSIYTLKLEIYLCNTNSWSLHHHLHWWQCSVSQINKSFLIEINA